MNVSISPMCDGGPGSGELDDIRLRRMFRDRYDEGAGVAEERRFFLFTRRKSDNDLRQARYRDVDVRVSYLPQRHVKLHTAKIRRHRFSANGRWLADKL